MTETNRPEDTMPTKEELRQELADHGITAHHKTGFKKLQEMLHNVLSGNSPAPQGKNIELNIQDKVGTKESFGTPPAPKAPTAPTEVALAAKRAATTLTREQKALKLSRVVVVPNDPDQASFPGLIFTVGSSKVNNGRMIKKFVPFNREGGWHVPQIILDTIEQAQMQKFRKITLPNGEKTMQPYLAKKFNVQYLEPLTQEEMSSLAAAQKATGDIS